MARVAAKRRAPRARTAAATLPQRRPAAVTRFLPSGRSILVAIVLAALGAGSYAAARETSLFAVSTVRVGGAPPSLSREVRKALAPLEGTSLVALGSDDVRDRLAGIAWVADVRYDRAFPHTLRVWIEPERPVAVLRRGADSWVVSAGGRVLEETERAAWRRLPRVWLPASASPRVGAPAPSVASPAVTALAPAAGLAFLARVRSVKLGEHTVTLVLRSGVEVRLGEAVDVPLKLEVARRLLADVAAPGYVDLSVPERPVVGGNPQVEG